MSQFVRFETPLRCRHTNRRLGLFAAAQRVLDREDVSEHVKSQLNSTLEWFNSESVSYTHLTLPTTPYV